MQLLSVSGLSSSKECQIAIKAFFESPEQRILICVADMRAVSKTQVNYLRTCIDEYYPQRNKSETEPDHIVVVIVVRVRHCNSNV
jgi:hypothetical protein